MPIELRHDYHPDEEVVMSIVRFSPDDGEEIFLSYSVGFEEGPEIIRTGVGPPSMRKPDEPAESTTDADEQRIGSWFIDEDCKIQEQTRVIAHLGIANKLYFGRKGTSIKDVAADIYWFINLTLVNSDVAQDSILV